MIYVLTGFRQAEMLRHFSFDCIAADFSRTPVVVTVDLNMARGYSIPLQELPLLCRDLLVRFDGVVPPELTLTEKEMISIRDLATRSAHLIEHRKQRTFRRRAEPNQDSPNH